MTRRHSFFAYAALLVGVIAFASSFTRTTSGQQRALNPAGEGRYRVAATATGNVSHLYVIDSLTGQTWAHQGNREWYDMGTPVPTK